MSDSATSPRQRILSAANELFYHLGYHASSISEIIAKADVAKATFYSHFSSKEALCIEYLEQQNQAELDLIRQAVSEAGGAFERYMAPAVLMEAYSANSELRGCRFINMAAEVPAVDSVLRKPGLDHYERLRTYLGELVRDLKESDPQAYTHIHVAAVTDTYLLLIGGGLAMAELFNELWPARHIAYAVEMLARPAYSITDAVNELKAVNPNK
ncbi:MAG: TetR/AcrR family transcriptional regulator [Pseudomonadales bacterium]